MRPSQSCPGRRSALPDADAKLTASASIWGDSTMSSSSRMTRGRRGAVSVPVQVASPAWARMSTRRALAQGSSATSANPISTARAGLPARPVAR